MSENIIQIENSEGTGSNISKRREHNICRGRYYQGSIKLSFP